MAQTLKFGNKTWATKVGSTLAYNDENGNYKPLPFAFTRSTSATRVNKEGLIEVVTNDRPRIDYTDTSDGVLLLEKAATNLIQYSEAFDNAYWLKNNSSVVSGFVSPYGTNNAFKLVENTSNTSHYINSGSLVTISGSSYTISVFVKKGESNFIQFLFSSASHGNQNFANFNLLNGTLGNVSNGVSKIESIGGFYKCSFTSTASSSTGSSSAFICKIQSETSARLESYLGDGTSGVYIFGAMLEQNSVASSYIPTQGSATTRVAETATDSGNSEVFNDSEGVLFANISGLDSNSTAKAITINQSSTNILGFYYYQSRIDAYVKVGTNQFFKTHYLDPTANVKISLKYKQNDFALWINGFEVSSLVGSGITPSGLNKLSFSDLDTNDFYGKTKEIGYYDTALTDLELETLTSYKSWTSMVNELNLNIIYNG